MEKIVPDAKGTELTKEVSFDILFYQSPQPMLVFEVEGLRILEVNQAAISLYGYQRNEFLEMTTRDLRVRSERKEFDKLIPSFKGEGTVYAEARHQLKSGKSIHAQICSYPLEYENKACRVGQIYNITSKVKQAQNLEVLLSVSKSISEELDPQSLLQKVAAATTELSGAEFGVFFYNSVKDNRRPELSYAFAGPLSDRLGDPVILNKLKSSYPSFDARVIRIHNLGSEGKHLEVDGEEINFSSYLSAPVISKSKSVVGSLCFFHTETNAFSDDAERMVVSIASQAAVSLDNAALFQEALTASKEKEELLKQAKEQNFKKDEFLSIASHELKTPVTSMKGYLQILDREFKKREETSLSDLLTKANKQVNKIVSLVDDLLNISKLESGKMEYNFQSFPLKEVLDDLALHFSRAGKTHSIRIFGDKEIQVYADKNRLEQVIVNLIDNAIKYSPKATEVLVGLSQPAGHFKMEIRDFGPGIPREKLLLIFERFYRVEDNSFSTSGLGLGLYISSEIIKRHKGKIGVESEMGKGSTFWFTIPDEKEISNFKF